MSDGLTGRPRVHIVGKTVSALSVVCAVSFQFLIQRDNLWLRDAFGQIANMALHDITWPLLSFYEKWRDWESLTSRQHATFHRNRLSVCVSISHPSKHAFLISLLITAAPKDKVKFYPVFVPERRTINWCKSTFTLASTTARQICRLTAWCHAY